MMPQLAPRVIPGAAKAALQQQAAMAAMQAPSVSNAPVFAAPNALPIAASIPAVAPSQTIGDQNELHRLQSTGSGISQIQNPFIRGVARVADTVGQFLAPNLDRLIGGTELKHREDVGRQAAMVGQDQTSEQAGAALQNTQAQDAQRSAKADLDAKMGELDLARARRADAQAQAAPAAPKTESLQQEHADAVMAALQAGQDPSKDPKVQSLADAITSLQPEHAAKAPNKDDRYIAIQSKPPSQWTPEEASFVKGYDQFVQKNKIQPAGVRASVMLQMPQAVVDPNDPSRTIYTTRRGALGMEAPTSGDATAARATIGDFTHGADSHTLNAGQTLTHHTALYDQAVDAVHNGNVQVLNHIGNELGIQMGSNAQTNLNLIRQGVAMEAARFYTGGVPGEHEIEQFNKSLSGDGSPAQMHGGASTVRSMAAGKMKSLQDQYNAGRQGQANFTTPQAPKEGDVKTNSHGDKVQFNGGKWVAK